MIRTGVLALVATAATAAAVLTGCSSSGAGAPAPAGKGAASATKATAVAAAGTTAAAPSGGGSASCRQLTIADVQPLQTDKIVKVDVRIPPEIGNAGQECLFDTADSSGSLWVEVASGPIATTLYTDDVQTATKPAGLAGIGDKATWDSGAESPALSAIHAGEYCHVDSNDPGSVPGTDRLYVANGHHTNIGDAAFAIVAAAFGTVCNRVFGSGNTTPDLSGLASVTAPAAPSDDGLPTDFTLPTDGPTS